MSRPPSQAIIEAVERAERDHRVAIYPGRSATRLRCRTCDRFVSEDHCLAEIARAAEQAADEKWMRWLIEQLHYGIDTSCEVDPPCTLADYAAMWERIEASGSDGASPTA